MADKKIMSGAAGQGVILEGKKASRALWQFCHNSVPAVVVALDADGVYQARFSGVGGGVVALELLSDLRPGALREQAPCSVSFHLGSRPGVFVARVEEFNTRREPPLLPLLALKYPQQIVVAETRRAFRFPVNSEVGLRVTMNTEAGQSLSAKAVDLGLNGVRIELLPLNEDPDLKIGAPVAVELRMQNYQLWLEAKVAHHPERRRYGLAFAEFGAEAKQRDKNTTSESDYELHEPPRALRTILKAIENQWMEQRAAAKGR